MSNRTRTLFRRLFVSAAVAMPLLAASAYALDPVPPVAQGKSEAPSRPRLSRLLEKVEKSRKLVDAEMKAKKLSAEEARALRKDLAALEKKARALAKKGRDLLEESEKSLNSELDALGRRIRS